MKKHIISLTITISLLFGLVPLNSFAQPLKDLPLNNGKVTVKPLVILVDFPDYKYTQFNEKEEHSKPYIRLDNYEPEWYEKVYFGDDPYDIRSVWYGNKGEEWVYEYPNNMTFKQYYDEQSRGLYNIEGDVLGWHTAKNSIRYYGENRASDYGGDQTRACELVQEAVQILSKDPSVDLSIYDVENKYDYNGDGNYHQPDGIIDTVILVHAGRGEEWGGGSIASDAMWPFRGKSTYYKTPYSEYEPFEVTDTHGNKIKVEDFLIVAQDSLPGIINHEYGHIMNLPDIYNGGGKETSGNWSLMSSSYLGEIPATESPSFGAYARQQLQEEHGGDFARIDNIEYYDIGKNGMDFTIGSITSKEETDTVRINLPPKINSIKPYDGEFMYYSQKENMLNNYMSKSLDLSKEQGNISLEFMTMYDIEEEWDYASVQVKEEGSDEWESIKGNITTTANPNKGVDDFERNPGHGITGDTKGKWITAKFDLTKYKGQNIDFKFHFFTDINTPNEGIYIDDIKVIADGKTIFFDNAEGEAHFEYNGFKKDDGIDVYGHYYLLEWRNHKGADAGLEKFTFGSWIKHASYDPGLVVWYINESLGTKERLDQATHAHPGEASVGVVDADQSPNYERDGYGEKPSANYIMRDSAFNLKKGSHYLYDNWGVANFDKNLAPRPLFDDGRDYTNPIDKELGLILNNYGINVLITEQSADGESVKIHVRNAKKPGNIIQETRDVTITDINSNVNNEVIVEVEGEDKGFNAYVSYVLDTDKGEKEYIQTLEFLDGKYRGKVDATTINPGEEWKVKYAIINGKEDSEGKRVYFSTAGDNQNSSMSTFLDLRKSENPDLKFKILYDIEEDWDYGSVQVRVAGEDKWEAIEGNITTTENPNGKESNPDGTGRNPGHGITGTTNGKWVDAEFDLKDYAGKALELRFYHWTDNNGPLNGMYVSDIKVLDNRNIMFNDMEGPSKFKLEGFINELPSREYNAKGIYNSDTNSGYGLDLNAGNIKKDKVDINYINLPEYFELGNNAHITVEIANNTKVMAETTLVVGLYSKDDSIMYTTVGTSKDIGAKKNAQMNVKLSIPSTGEYKVKAFIINNLMDGTVLSNDIEIPVK